ncbi:MAG: hypothetical protein J7L14_00480 [Candidatus Diapherotrites archaeon]|nr:hypothetical protein [Candidatus Diapherotrites archaeon]
MKVLTKSIGIIFIMLILIVISGFSLSYGKESTIALNFDNVDIAVFLKTMSDITGKNFILNNKVRGKISFVSSRKIPISKVYDIVLAILKTQGFTAVEEESIVKVYPTQVALRMSGEIHFGTEPLKPKKGVIVTQIIPLKYAEVSNVIPVIKAIFGNDLLITSYRRTNVIIANGDVPYINLLLRIAEYIDTPMPQEKSDIHIYKLENSDAEAMAKTLQALSSSIQVKKPNLPKNTRVNVPSSGLAFSERFRVVASKETNSIIVISAPGDYQKIERIIKKLDVKRQQVLVEALILEITLNNDQTLGFDWNALIKTGKGVNGLLSSNTGLMQQSIQTGGLYGLTIGLLNGTIPSVYAILNANRDNTNFKILSTPEIVTLDNQEANITIGEQVPFLTSSRVDENNNVISTYDYKDIGIVLKLTPHVNENGFITMDINQQVKKLVEGTSVLENPSVYNREITSKITVKNERTIVIGGLIRDDNVEVEQKVPVLGDIPILGLFFRKKTKNRVRTNLLIFITPHIITNESDMIKITEEKRKAQEKFEKENKTKGKRNR